MSTLYFADIARMPLDEFIDRSLHEPAEQVEIDALEQTHAVARIAASKLQLVRRAFLVMLGALLAWFGLIVIAKLSARRLTPARYASAPRTRRRDPRAR